MKDFLQVIVFAGAFAVLFIPLIVSDSMFFPFITGKNFYFRIIVELTLAAWVLLAVLDARYRPQFSWLLAATSIFLVIVAIADAHGIYPPKSFWSNFERMDGFVTLAHFFAYFLVLGSLLSAREFTFMGYKTTSWRLFMGTAMIAGLVVAFTAFRQLAGAEVITQGGWRITGTLGNAAYMAIYMLFNTFIALWLLAHAKTRSWRIAYGLLVALFAFLLIQTATRGTIVGLVGGSVLGAAYIALFNREYPGVRKAALGILVAVVLVAGGLYLGQDSELVQGNQILRQATNISLGELELRMTIWNMAVEGVKERPLLGWGQGNFNYVFNREYVPEIYYAELWYDRAHDIIFDWLIAAGVLGLLAYLSIFAALAYYLLWLPWRQESPFSVTERGLLIGITAGYCLHNLVVFDNVVSYIFFAVLLALVHSRFAQPIPRLQALTFDPKVVSWVVAPLALIITGTAVYFINLPSMWAAGDIIDAFTAPTLEQQLAAFERAYDRRSFADQEITEQLTQRAINLTGDANVPPETKQAFANLADEKLQQLAADKPGDARVHVFMSSFYRSVGNLEEAAKQAARARELSPNKPAIVFEQAITEYSRGDYEAMNEFFKQAYELAPQNPDAQIFYAAAQLYVDPDVNVHDIVTDTIWPRFAKNNFALQAADVNQRYDVLGEMLAEQIELQPQDPQLYASKAFVEYQSGDTAAAVATLRQAAEAIPSFAERSQCYIANIEAGRTPDEGC